MDPSQTTQQLIFKLNLTQRVVLKWLDRQMLEAVGATYTQVAVLLYLMENDGCSQVELSKTLLQNKSAITTLVDRMIKNELLVKSASKKDGRMHVLHLSPKGRQVGERAIPYIDEYNRELTKEFATGEKEVINRFFDSATERFAEPNENS